MEIGKRPTAGYIKHLLTDTTQFKGGSGCSVFFFFIRERYNDKKNIASIRREQYFVRPKRPTSINNDTELSFGLGEIVMIVINGRTILLLRISRGRHVLSSRRAHVSRWRPQTARDARPSSVDNATLTVKKYEFIANVFLFADGGKKNNKKTIRPRKTGATLGI